MIDISDSVIGAYLNLKRVHFSDYGVKTPFFYKQSFFDPQPENCLSFSKKSPQKLFSICLVDGLHVFLIRKSFFCLSLNFLNVMLEIRLRFSFFFLNFYVFIFSNSLFNRFNTNKG